MIVVVARLEGGQVVLALEIDTADPEPGWADDDLAAGGVPNPLGPARVIRAGLRNRLEAPVGVTIEYDGQGGRRDLVRDYTAPGADAADSPFEAVVEAPRNRRVTFGRLSVSLAVGTTPPGGPTRVGRAPDPPPAYADK